MRQAATWLIRVLEAAAVPQSAGTSGRHARLRHARRAYVARPGPAPSWQHW